MRQFHGPNRLGGSPGLPHVGFVESGKAQVEELFARLVLGADDKGCLEWAGGDGLMFTHRSGRLQGRPGRFRQIMKHFAHGHHDPQVR
jgi:hypothetical protein